MESRIETLDWWVWVISEKEGRMGTCRLGTRLKG